MDDQTKLKPVEVEVRGSAPGPDTSPEPAEPPPAPIAAAAPAPPAPPPELTDDQIKRMLDARDWEIDSLWGETITDSLIAAAKGIVVASGHGADAVNGVFDPGIHFRDGVAGAMTTSLRALLLLNVWNDSPVLHRIMSSD